MYDNAAANPPGNEEPTRIPRVICMVQRHYISVSILFVHSYVKIVLALQHGAVSEYKVDDLVPKSFER